MANDSDKISAEKWASTNWDEMRGKGWRSWRNKLTRVLKSFMASVAEGDKKAVAVARERIGKLVAEASSDPAYRDVIAAAKGVAHDIDRDKFLTAAKKLASVTASIVVRVRPLGKASKQFDKAAAKLELKKWISGLVTAESVLKRLEAMKKAGFGDGTDFQVNVGSFLEAAQGLVKDLS